MKLLQEKLHLKTFYVPTLVQDGSFLESPSVFRVYVEKLFWEGEQKTKESEADQPVSDK